jgi:hypothetical protein
MMRGLIIAGCIAVFVADSSAQAQDPRLARRLDPQILGEVQALIDSARAAGIPTEPLADKAFEGARKGGTGAAIVDAVRKSAIRLGAARTALFPAGEAEIMAGAGALNWGVPQATLTQLRRVRPGSDLTVPVSVLADLVSRGVQLDTASAVVIALVSTNMRDTDLIKFRQTVERDIALGSLPAAAVTTRAEAAGISDLATGATAPNNGPGRAPTTPSPKPPIKP